MLSAEGNKLVFRFDDHLLWIQPWGENALRVRATKLASMPTEDWALTDHPASPSISIATPKDQDATIINGKIRATVSQRGKIIIYNSNGTKLLEEYARNRRDPRDAKCSALEIEARELRPILGGDFRLTTRFESLDPTEKIFGMGQYQQPYLNLKGADLELAHRNSQASVPFAVSSRGYGLLWNNPGIGRAVFGSNIMSFEAYSTRSLDYWVVAEDTPAEIVEAYAKATGYVPMMPEYGLGFWQCEWKFDPKFWPDVDAMVKELQELNIELMVSIWPTVENASENYSEMLERGLLIRHDRGMRVAMQCDGDITYFDATNPEAREFVWSKAKKHYYELGIKVFWLDEAEPEYSTYDFDIYRYHAGSNLQIGNIFPKEYARGFYEGMQKEGQENIVNLLRCAWAGSQKYGALVWSGDIASSWSSFRNQLAAGLNMGLAGIPWWTTDIGGFHGGNPDEPEFRELFTRWFQWGTFCPVMRLHGDREPKPEGPTSSGADNEIWSYGEEVYEICKRFIGVREELREYTRNLMKEAHEKGSPVMRTLFYEFPEDKQAWEVDTAYMFGPKYLVAPVFEPGQRKISVYLPAGAYWTLWGKVNIQREAIPKIFQGGNTVEVDCPIDTIPVFYRVNS
ncbi:hypothetical protein N7466_003664 [Penicillium verhagenii]|uniref:uncharacterized protein n=1 Tax=Penicillium verhagenii TaxID=1562060 RepID=UPI00254531A6|nr:uncharacterized protein N7466_003664 [Penicillium verhagenii]KAJ5934117.1 hypothetical protein N7466_003664 [Penicillium verhagenii]